MKTGKPQLWLFLLFCCLGASLPLQAAMHTEVHENQLRIKTTQQGVAGLQGCDSEQLREVPAYVFNLYRADGDLVDCGDDEPFLGLNWNLVSQTPSPNSGKMEFTDLPPGTYKVLCYYGKAEGCILEVTEKDKWPTQSIIYHQEESELITIPPVQTNLLLSSATINIYPTPAENKLFIESQASLDDQLLVATFYDLTGKAIHYFSVPAGTTHEVNVAHLPSGTYLIKISNEADQLLHQQKVVVIRR